MNREVMIVTGASQISMAIYRHIDTAAMYFNEVDVVKAIRDSGILIKCRSW